MTIVKIESLKFKRKVFEGCFNLRTKEIKVSDDITRKQREKKTAELRANGEIGYFSV